MAASRTPSATAIQNKSASRCISFAKIDEPIEVPNLIALQTESFDWLLGNKAWKARVTAAKKEGRNDVPETAGLEEIFQEISPIEDFGQTMSLSFSDAYFEDPRHSPLLGWGAIIGLGCSIGTFLSGTQAMALSGWVFAISMVVALAVGFKLNLHKS